MWSHTLALIDSVWSLASRTSPPKVNLSIAPPWMMICSTMFWLHINHPLESFVKQTKKYFSDFSFILSSAKYLEYYHSIYVHDISISIKSRKKQHGHSCACESFKFIHTTKWTFQEWLITELNFSKWLLFSNL